MNTSHVSIYVKAIVKITFQKNRITNINNFITEVL